MSAISITKLYDLLSTKLGKETAENLTTFIEHKINDGLESQSTILATKEDLAKLSLATKEDLVRLSQATKEDLAKLKVDFSDLRVEFANLREDVAKLDGKLEAKTSETKSEIIKWMFIFWIGQAAVTFSFIMLYLRK